MRQIFKNKTVLLTGASSGIGAALARELHLQEARLILTARSEERLKRIQAECPDSIVIPGDLLDPTFPARLAAMAHDHGPVDILVNNAGFGYYGPFHKGPLDPYTGIIQVNITALTELTHRLLPAMLANNPQDKGIINIGSIVGLFPLPNHGVYGASKAYVNSFSQALREELRGTGVRVLCVCPGGTKTEFDRVAGERGDWPFIMKPERVARIALDAYSKNKRLVVPGAINRLVSLFTRVIPPGLTIRAAGKVMKQP
ncbi:SDR family NAD(P)-dependent oxidoreductase [Candidatus Neomarinimicrobiota bacterium]